MESKSKKNAEGRLTRDDLAALGFRDAGGGRFAKGALRLDAELAPGGEVLSVAVPGVMPRTPVGEWDGRTWLRERVAEAIEERRVDEMLDSLEKRREAEAAYRATAEWLATLLADLENGVAEELP